MRVNRIALTNFRNYDFGTADFSPGTNVIRGENAQGKTNLLEAVYMLSAGRSFRTRYDRELVAFGSTGADILADVTAHGREQTVKITLTPGQRKQIQINSVRKNASELSECVSCVLFCPDDLGIVKDGAAARRRFMDNAICQIRPKYAALLTEYNRLYEQKSAILRDWREKPSLLDTLDDFSAGMCRITARLIVYRRSFTERIEKDASAIAREFSGGSDELRLQYGTVSTVDLDNCHTERDYYYTVCEHQEKHRRAELESGQCLTGAHKDDIAVFINGKSARAFASQGQTRTAALSLKLAERELLRAENGGEYPIMLLDDVLSELDAKRQEFVLNRIGGGQTFITCCEDDGVAGRTGGRVLTVAGGRIT